MHAYSYPWQNPIIVTFGKNDVNIEGPPLPIVQIYDDLVKSLVCNSNNRNKKFHIIS